MILRTKVRIILLAAIIINAISSEVKHYPALSPEFSYHGRYYTQDGQVKYDWSCFKIDFCFNASKVEWLGEDTWNIYQIRIDGERVNKIELKNQKQFTLFEANNPESHCLELIKITENQFGSSKYGKDCIFDGAKVYGGTLRKTQNTNTQKFEFYGDSLTTGYGINSGRQKTCIFHVRQIQNCRLTWASLLSQKFNADYRIEAITGKGLVKNYYSVTGPTMPSLFTRTTSISEDNSYKYQDGWVPDILFVLIGGNDFSRAVKPKTSKFVQTFIASMEHTLRTQYLATGKMSKIVAICGKDMPKKLCPSVQQSVRQIKYSYNKVYYLQMPKDTWSKETEGCMGHPNQKGHQNMANSLEQGVRKILLDLDN